MKIFAIETSCDETACSVVEDGVKEISNVVASSADLHEITGGVVPEIAARKQVESIVPVIQQCLRISKLSVSDIDKIAVTVGPGLIGSLLVGVEAAKSLALSWNKPLIPVNHLIGHIYGNYVENDKVSEIKFPAIVLIISGGHTDLVLMKDHAKFEYLGGTLDDAVGEAFDKVARLLGLAKYLGGVELSKKAAECKNNTLQGMLPRPLMDKNDYNFSFSGLKSATRRVIEHEKDSIEAVACEFESAVTDVLVKKTIKAATDNSVKSLLLGGGVSANTFIRNRMKYEAEEIGVPLWKPPLKYCGDNAVYIASAAYFNNQQKPLKDILANPSLTIMDIYP